MPSKQPPQELTDADRFRDLMVLPEPTNLLKLAERTYAKLRADHRTATATLAAAIAEHKRNANVVPVEDINELKAALVALEEPLREARRERDRRREEFGRKATEALAPTIAEYCATISQRLNDVEHLIHVGLDLHTSATVTGIAAHRVVEGSEALAACVHQMRRIMRGG